jgi:[ribosomal protein S5]-alanine N-acetyltransferase
LQPTLESGRLILRPYLESDAKAVQSLAGDRLISDTTTTIPHPYPDGAAEAWIASHGSAYEQRREITFALELRSSGELIGAVSLLDLQARHARAEVGYWTGVPYWGRGYCTEAVGRLIPFAYEDLSVTKVVGRCLARNPASARVMVKAGFKSEGRLVQHTLKGGVYEDVLLFGLVLPGRGEA